jgi:3-oxoadipate enol-lactonase
MPFTDTHGVRLHWQEQGSGTPVLLIMGANFSSKLWYPAVSALAKEHRVISFDNRGTGESSPTSVASIPDMAADARAVLDAAGVHQAHVYGISLGGVIAQQLALESPGRVLSLTLGATGILTADRPRARKARNLLFWLPKSLILALSKKALYGPACPPDALAKDIAVLKVDKTHRRSLVAQQNALRAYSVTAEQVATLSMPVLVLHGTADGIVEPAAGEELADTLTQARLATYQGAGHNYLVAAGDRANTDVLAFLDDVDAGRTAPRTSLTQQ